MTSAVNQRQPAHEAGFLVMHRFLFLTLFCATLLAACGDGPERGRLSGGTMGTTWSVVYGNAKAVDGDHLRGLIEQELADVNDALSTYLPEAEISRLNAREEAVEQRLSPRFAEVLTAALEIGSMTGGAYDVTVGPLVELWGFGARVFDGGVPDAETVAQVARRVGAQRLAWDAESRTLSRPAGMRIDLSSIAKGYAVDRVSALLLEQGLGNTLVEIGGELRARGTRPEGGPWRLAVESPDPEGQRFIEALMVSDAAVATSGDYRNFFEVDGRRYSHLVDPRTGYPVEHELVSVTVIHENCMEADGLATALIVLGLEPALALAESNNLAAHFVSRGADGLEVHYTLAFNQYRRQAASGEGDPADTSGPGAAPASDGLNARG